MTTARVERAATNLGARSHRRLVELIETQEAKALWRKHRTESIRFLSSEPAANASLQLVG